MLQKEMFSEHPGALCSTVGHRGLFLEATLKEPLKELNHV